MTAAGVALRLTGVVPSKPPPRSRDQHLAPPISKHALVEIVIGVDTNTHTAAVIATDTRAVLAAATANADEDGYAELVASAETHGVLRG